MLSQVVASPPLLRSSITTDTAKSDQLEQEKTQPSSETYIRASVASTDALTVNITS